MRITPATSASHSPYQRAVFEHVERSGANAVVMATAGSGKTTTLVEVARRLPSGSRACFLAFNRSTAAELRARLPSGVHATTIHALGLAALAKSYPAVAGSRVDHGKYSRLALEAVAELHPDGHGSLAPGLADHLARLVHFARLELTNPHDLAAVSELVNRYGIEAPVAPDQLSDLYALVAPIIRAGTAAASRGSIDLTDMVYLVVTERLQLEDYDFVCVDEAQDLSRMALALVLRLVEGGARALFVGDPRQAIYAFAGADPRSLERARREASATVLPLSVSYRCPTRHVALARRFAPEMDAAPGARLGSVRLLTEARLARTVQPRDLVMARVNSPLLAVSLRLAEAGTPVTVLGEELEAELHALARRIFPGRARLPHTALADVRRHATSEGRRLEREFMTSPRLAQLQSRNADTHRALALVIEAAYDERPANAVAAVRGLWRSQELDFSQLERVTCRLLAPRTGTDGAVLSTIHKAKGREAERVFLLRPEELGIGGADENDDAVEANVLFVALTRAKRELVFVERHAGAVAERLRGHASRPPGNRLERDWDEVLRLALVMNRAARAGRPPLRGLRLRA